MKQEHEPPVGRMFNAHLRQAERLRIRGKHQPWREALREAGNEFRRRKRNLSRTTQSAFEDLLHASAAAACLTFYFNKQVPNVLTMRRPQDRDELFRQVREALKIARPCDICHGLGKHDDRTCLACDGSRMLQLRSITCPECKGRGDGEAYVPSLGGGRGICGRCLGAKVVDIDRFNRHFWGDVSVAMNISALQSH